MSQRNIKKVISITWLHPVIVAVAMLLFTAPVHAAAPGITGPTFNLVASESYISQPDGMAIYSWGYGCKSAPSGFAPSAIGQRNLLDYANPRSNLDCH